MLRLGGFQTWCLLDWLETGAAEGYRRFPSRARASCSTQSPKSKAARENLLRARLSKGSLFEATSSHRARQGGQRIRWRRGPGAATPTRTDNNDGACAQGGVAQRRHCSMPRYINIADERDTFATHAPARSPHRWHARALPKPTQHWDQKCSLAARMSLLLACSNSSTVQSVRLIAERSTA